MTKQSGSLIHNGTKFYFEIDENGYIWIIKDNTRFNVGQVRPLNSQDNIEDTIHEMLYGAGY